MYYITFIDLTEPFEIYDALDKLWLENKNKIVKFHTT